MATGTNLGRIKNKKIQKNNTSGCTGVSFHTCKGQWYARIAFKGKNYNLGYFDNIQVSLNKSALHSNLFQVLQVFLQFYF